MGTTPMKYAQGVIEATWGTDPTTATAKYMALDTVEMTFDIANTQRTYLDGNIAPSQNAYQTYKGGMATLAGDFTFEDGIVYGDAAIKGSVSPSTTDTNGRIYVFTAPTTAAPATRSRTLQFYDGSQGYHLTGALVKTLKLSGSAGAGNMVRAEATWLGKTITKTAPTAAIANRTVTALPANLMSLYIDAYGGTVGTTAKAATLIDWTWEYDSGLHLTQFQDASLAPSSYGYGRPSVKLSVTAEFNSVGIAEIDAYLAGTGRLYRVQGISTVLAGSTSAYKTLQLDVAGDIVGQIKWIGDRDGNTTVQFDVLGRYDAGAFANYAKMTIWNALTAWPDA